MLAMIVAEPLGSTEDKSLELELGRNIHNLARGGAAFRQPESGDGETSAENLGNLLRQVSKTSMDEIDNLISELQTLQRKLQTDGDRIEGDIAKYHRSHHSHTHGVVRCNSPSVGRRPNSRMTEFGRRVGRFVKQRYMLSVIGLRDLGPDCGGVSTGDGKHGSIIPGRVRSRNDMDGV